MNGVNYEKFLKQYFEAQLLKEYNRYIEVKHQETLLTPTGQKHKIDLNYTFEINNTRYLTVIECKCWKRRVTRNMTLTFNSVIESLNAHKGIMVTTVGYDSGAIAFAKEKGIALFKMTTTSTFETMLNFTGIDRNLL